MLLEKPRLLILDEPNSALNKRETERLFAVLRQLRERGATMLYVSHRLEEVFAISDRVTVDAQRQGRDDPRSRRTDHSRSDRRDDRRASGELFPAAARRATGRRQPAELEVEGVSGGELEASISRRDPARSWACGPRRGWRFHIVSILFGARSASAGDATYPDGARICRAAPPKRRGAASGWCLLTADAAV